MKKLTKKQIKAQEKKEVNKKFKEWSTLVKNRDNNKCVICEETNRLNAHHIIGRYNKELRFDINNGISLCPYHHMFCKEISGHKNAFMLAIWLMKNRPKQFKYLIKNAYKG